MRFLQEIYEQTAKLNAIGEGRLVEEDQTGDSDASGKQDNR